MRAQFGGAVAGFAVRDSHALTRNHVVCPRENRATHGGHSNGRRGRTLRRGMWAAALILGGLWSVPAGAAVLGAASGWQDVRTPSPTAAPMFRESFEVSRLLWVLFGTQGTMFLLVPGFAAYYAALTGWRERSELVERTISVFAVAALLWVLWVYSACFGPRESATLSPPGESGIADTPAATPQTWIGGPDFILLRGMSSELATDRPDYPVRQLADGVPHLLFMAYQMSWFTASAVPMVFLLRRIYPGFVGWLAFVLWSTLVFAPLTHAVVGGGALSAVLDFGGVLPGHVAVGCSLLVLNCLVRRSTSLDPVSGEATANPALAGIGTILVWCGTLCLLTTKARFGYGTLANVLVSSHLAAAAGTIAISLSRWVSGASRDCGDVSRGALFGLVANAPAAGFVAPQSSLLIGLAAAIVCDAALRLLRRWIVRAAVAEAVTLHGVAAAVGVLLTGVFATSSVSGFDAAGGEINGVLAGNVAQLWVQIKGLGCTCAVAAAGTAALWLVSELISRSSKKLSAQVTRA